MNIVLGLAASLAHCGNTLYTAVSLAPVQHHAERAAVVVLDDVDDAAPKCRLQQIGVGEQQRSGPYPVRRRRDVVLRIL